MGGSGEEARARADSRATATQEAQSAAPGDPNAESKWAFTSRALSFASEPFGEIVSRTFLSPA